MNVTINGVDYFPRAAASVGDHKFRDVVRATRKAIGYTLDDACHHIGCSKSYLWGLENGGNEPSLRMAAKIAYAYGITLESLAASLPEVATQGAHHE